MTDPYFANVKLLLHFDGADASTTVTDQKGHAMTCVGNAQLDTAQFKFGTASALFDGAGDKITTPASADWNFGTGDFTIEAWVKNSVAAGTYIPIAGMYGGVTNGAWYWVVRNGSGTNNVVFYYYSVGWQQVSCSPNFNVNDGNWHHIAVSRQGNNIWIYGDGARRGTTTGVSSHTISSSGVQLNIGFEDNYSNYYTGWIDEMRITKGVARYDQATYTTPAVPFLDS